MTPIPERLPVRMIQASEDGLCPLAQPLQGVDPQHDYIVMPGGHSSLVVARPFYVKTREFLDREEDSVGQTTRVGHGEVAAKSRLAVAAAGPANAAPPAG